MVRRIAALLLALLPSAPLASAQQPLPLYPGALPRPVEQQELPPPTAQPETARPSAPAPPPPAAPAAAPAAAVAEPPAPADSSELAPAAEREFCGQSVGLRLADRDAVSEHYRAFLGIWSDASWTPQLCAALIVENVAPDGTATIVYVFGPMSTNTRTPGGVLHGTGIIRDGELRFQNSNGSQFAFRPIYADLDGRLTTPRGQTYQAIFKKTL